MLINMLLTYVNNIMLINHGVVAPWSHMLFPATPSNPGDSSSSLLVTTWKHGLSPLSRMTFLSHRCWWTPRISLVGYRPPTTTLSWLVTFQRKDQGQKKCGMLHLTPTRIAIIKQQQQQKKNKCWWGRGEIGTLVPGQWGSPCRKQLCSS